MAVLYKSCSASASLPPPLPSNFFLFFHIGSSSVNQWSTAARRELTNRFSRLLYSCSKIIKNNSIVWVIRSRFTNDLKSINCQAEIMDDTRNIIVVEVAG